MKKGQIRTKEKLKLKRTRRRSGWKHYVVLLIVLVGLFLSIGKYFGDQAELVFHQYLYSHSKVMGEKLIRIELLDYQKNVLGAEAHLRLSSDIPIVAEGLGEVRIKAKLLNGPFFLTNQGVSLGSSRWVFTIDEENSAENDIENLQVLFPKRLPKVVIRTDFKHQAHYFSRIKTNIAKFILSGYYKFETNEQNESNHGSIQIENLKLGVPPATVHIDTLSISYQQNGQAVSAGYKPGVTAIRSPQIIINHPYLKQSIAISLVAKSDLSIEDDLLKGYVHVDIESLDKEKELPFDVANTSLTFKGLSAEGVIALSDANAELDNLKQQVDWTLEDMGAYPEGRDEIIQLKDKINAAQKEIGSTLFNKVLHSSDSLFKLEAKSQKDNSQSKVVIVLNKNKSTGMQTNKEGLSTSVGGEIFGHLSDEWQRFLSTLFHRMGKDKLITINNDFKVDLEKAISLFE